MNSSLSVPSLSRAGRLFALLSLLAAVQSALPAQGQSQVVFSYPFDGTGTVIVSSWLDPDGSDSDMYAYDDFTLASAQAITQVQWRGGYAYGAPYGHVTNFTITFFESIAGGSQPHVTNPQLPEIYLAQYNVGGIAGETAAGTFGGIAMYDYTYTLPTPFQAAAGTKYWIRIEGVQAGYPDWGLASGSGGDGQHFQFSTGAAQFSFGQHDTAFSLLADTGPSCTISATAAPPEGGTVTGAGVYPVNSTAMLTAASNPGYGFVNWTENGTVASTSATYSFTATGDRSLVANFAPSHDITTSVNPFNGGTTTGDGSYVSGASATVTATANTGFAFKNWTEAGVEASTSASYTFTVTSSRYLTANFTQTATVALFDFDTGTPPLGPGQGLPVTQTVNGITGTFSAAGMSGFSIQSQSTTFFNLSLFSGNYIYPNSLDRSVLDMAFSVPLTHISLKFATTDNHQNEVPTNIVVTAYNDSTSTSPVGSVSAHAAYGSDTFPMGEIAFDSPGQTFNLVEITIPYQPLGTTNFLVDNVTVVSNAVASVTVPSLVGLSEAEASAQLQAAGLLQGAVTVATDPSVPAGAVLSQNPVAGALVLPGTAVDYTVSLGPPLVLTVVRFPLTTKVGDRAEMAVLAGNVHGGVTYQWYRREGAVLSSVAGANGATLSLENVTPQDAGVYLCEAPDDYDTVQSADITLSIAAAVPVSGIGGLAALCGAFVAASWRLERRTRRKRPGGGAV